MSPLVALLLTAASLDEAGLQVDFKRLTSGFQGRVGVCVQVGEKPVCNLGEQRFSIQSVMKMLVGLAVMDAVDTKGWKVDTKLRVYRKDMSVFMQPIADKLGPDGYETTIGELILRANRDSDSAAGDILLERLGGPAAVAEVLKRKGIRNVRLDRNERDLQTEIVGIRWRPEFVEPKVLESAIAAVPEAERTIAHRKYRTDVRDTATPAGMTDLLQRLVQGKLLSAASTKYFMDVLEKTETGKDRLKAGLAPGWRLAHKTGTSGAWKGLAVATNDVGILISPTGVPMAISVFVADSTETDARNAAMIANMARAAIARLRLD